MAIELLTLKHFQKTWNCYKTFPDEIITVILVKLHYLFEYETYPCKKESCFDDWVGLKEREEEDKHFHCSCHETLEKDEGFSCDRCGVYSCEYCIFHVDDNPQFGDSDFDSDETYETFHYCIKCIEKIKLLNYRVNLCTNSLFKTYRYL